MEKWRPPDWDKRVEARIKEVNSQNPIVVSIKDNMEAGADAILEALFELAKQSPTGKFEIDAETQWIYEGADDKV